MKAGHGRVATAAVAAALLATAGCGGSSSSSSSEAADSGPEVVLRCLQAHHLDAALSSKGKQFNLASLHEIRISRPPNGDAGDPLVEFFATPRFASGAEKTARQLQLNAASKGVVQWDYPKTTPASIGQIVGACASSGA
jgi:hypothetical protein